MEKLFAEMGGGFWIFAGLLILSARYGWAGVVLFWGGALAIFLGRLLLRGLRPWLRNLLWSDWPPHAAEGRHSSSGLSHPPPRK